MIRLRAAGGMVPLGKPGAIRFDRRFVLDKGWLSVHAVIEEALDIEGHLAAVVVDVSFSPEELMNLHDVIHRLIDRRGAMTEEEASQMHDAVEAHAQGLDDSQQITDRRAAAANSGLADKFANVSDADLTERAADGEVEAQQERLRRRVLADAQPAAKVKVAAGAKS